MHTEDTTQNITAEAAVIYVALDDATVVSLATGLHDQKCRTARSCLRRQAHAMDTFGELARNTLTILASTPWSEKH